MNTLGNSPIVGTRTPAVSANVRANEIECKQQQLIKIGTLLCQPRVLDNNATKTIRDNLTILGQSKGKLGFAGRLKMTRSFCYALVLMYWHQRGCGGTNYHLPYNIGVALNHVREHLYWDNLITDWEPVTSVGSDKYHKEICDAIKKFLSAPENISSTQGDYNLYDIILSFDKHGRNGMGSEGYSMSTFTTY